MPHFGNYNPATFGWARPSHFDSYSHWGIPIAGGINPAPGYATLLTAMLDALVPHIPGGLIAGQCWGGDFDFTPPWFHPYGLAVDLNAPENPMYPGSAHPGHTLTGPGDLPADTGAMIRPYGFEWGGDWSSPLDYMHCECHLTPQEVATLAASLGDDMSAADVAAITAHIDAALAPVKTELAHLRTFIDGNKLSTGGYDANGQASRAKETLARVKGLT